MLYNHQRFTKEKAWQKIKYYCAYHQRSHQQVKEKLYSLGLHKTETEQLLSQLIEENYLNEERFAAAFASGKFNIKKWGKIKIEYELKQKKVSIYNIRNALKQIDEKEYFLTLQKLAKHKWENFKHEQYINRQTKTMHYLMQKGYEPQLAQQAIKSIRENAKL